MLARHIQLPLVGRGWSHRTRETLRLDGYMRVDKIISELQDSKVLEMVIRRDDFTCIKWTVIQTSCISDSFVGRDAATPSFPALKALPITLF